MVIVRGTGSPAATDTVRPCVIDDGRFRRRRTNTSNQTTATPDAGTVVVGWLGTEGSDIEADSRAPLSR